ncbi:F0F1 ATP synthase subunit gamma [Tessaracoccus sp. OH4464_COT-324]|uniref:F0F1 ATP synthase subunit gamma n=1 Tax=Tessaracoccus sp. OH4464_COT-324 TaxID=2491059 RepID=UPI000F62E855|nr:F0F1 ATP synthase subunit gamma [Tessaracoccus sp. OH4464_COT-324]RRD47890.1 F0F1 ATP synthase subunit gamma [Tessaracoccus sp. OH4464_COT-324]
MGSSLRELRQRRKSVTETKKITRAMELIASSRIVKAQNAQRAALPYTVELTKAVSMLASANREIDHPLLQPVNYSKRSALLVITGDRGLSGAYSTNAIKLGEQVEEYLKEYGQEVDLYISGKKGVAYHEFRGRQIKKSWTGFSERPTARDAREIARDLLEAFLTPTEEGGVDEIHVVTTRFRSMISQKPHAKRLVPLEVVDQSPDEFPDESDNHFYKFEPNAKTVLDALLPLYITNRIQIALLDAAASELASRQQAMKSATDNAQTLIEQLTRAANQARQAEITQEITEIVGGAAALSESA